MNILHLNLHQKWFDMILSGEKLEEYREISVFWWKVFAASKIRIKGKALKPSDVVICFSNGYAKNRRQMLVQVKSVSAGIGRTEWGAPDYEVFRIKLGKVIKSGTNILQSKAVHPDVLDSISRMGDTGRPGCTYGDTDLDSMAVAYGYNLAVADILSTLKKFE